MIGWQEWAAAADRGLDPPEVALLVVLTFGIGAVTLRNPLLTQRLENSRRAADATEPRRPRERSPSPTR